MFVVRATISSVVPLLIKLQKLFQIQQIGPSSSESTYTLGEHDIAEDAAISKEMYGERVSSPSSKPRSRKHSKSVESDSDKNSGSKLERTKSGSVDRTTRKDKSSLSRGNSKEDSPVKTVISAHSVTNGGEVQEDISKNPFDTEEDDTDSRNVTEEWVKNSEDDTQGSNRSVLL